MDRKYIEHGPKTYYRFFIKQAFDDNISESNTRWDRLIRNKLSSSESWSAYHTNQKTKLSKWSISFVREMKFKLGAIVFKIELFRDGFHISIRQSTALRLPNYIIYNLRKKIFGDRNRSSGWTPTIEKVALMANAIVEEVKEYLESDRNTT